MGHRLLANLDPGQRCVFQGLVYHIKPGPTPGTGTLVGYGEVDHRPDHQPYVWVEYTITDALGVAEVGYRYPAGRLIPLASGGRTPVEALAPGAVFLLEEGGTATVTQVGHPKRWEPDEEYQDAYGNGFRRVVGTFKFTGWVPLMSVTVGGETHRVTPGHRYWSETRQGWYPIGTFAVGELLRTKQNRPIPVERIVPPQWEHTTVYNFEVDEYHTYFVGRGTTAVWSHNGLGGAGCGVPKAAIPDEAVPARMRNFHADADLLLERLGSASRSHPEEYARIMADLEAAGVDIATRPGTLAYSPSRGSPGRMILDPETSIGALRHEYQHFLDHRAADFPGFRPYYENPAEFARLEVRGYMREVHTARETGHADLVPAITQQMRARVRELMGGN